jgi:parallel beta-helix repeat protein
VDLVIGPGDNIGVRARSIAYVLAAILSLVVGCGFDASNPASVPADRAIPADSGTCDRYASPAGRDTWPGTLRRPFRSVNRLQSSLRPGQVACLRRGTYSGDVTLRRGGTPGRPAVLRAHRNERVTLSGRLWVARGADDLVISRLHLDGRNDRRLPSPTVNADRVSFKRVEVTNHHTGICFVLGSREYGAADGTRIEASRIHDCGRLPTTNHDHGIYVEEASGTRIVGNWIYDNADRGIQLYPSAQGTVVTGNVITRNGSGVLMSGDHGLVSNDTRIEGNVISHSVRRFNVESYYPPGNPIGKRNRVVRNCVSGGARGAESGGVQTPPRGFDLQENVVATPAFADPRADDFRLKRSGPCRTILGKWADVIPGPRP